MPRAKLIHNPKAGDGKLDKKGLLQLLKEKGYTVNYANAKKSGWDDWDEEDDMVIVAGGDGTVRKTVKKMAARHLIDKRFPIAVLPFGTANNIATTFYKNMDVPAVIAQWEKQHTRPIDIARVRGAGKEYFFMESLGAGVLPVLMQEMKKREDTEEMTAEEELCAAQEMLAKIVNEYTPHPCRLTIDGEDYSGEYVLIEIMNIRSVGPNLHLAPDADPSDGLLNIVLIDASEQKKLANYVQALAAGKKTKYQFRQLTGTDIRMEWAGTALHVDDQLAITKRNTPVHIQLEPGLLHFFTDADI